MIDTTISKEELLRSDYYLFIRRVYHITPKKLEGLVFSFAGQSVKQINIKVALQKYKAVTKMINN